MAITRAMQQWTTVSGPTTGLTQAEDEYLDVMGYQDIVIYPQFASVSAFVPTLTLETAPAKEEGLFLTLASQAASTTLAPIVVRYSGGTPANPPLARYLRWRLSSSGAWTVTMRIIVALNPSIYRGQ